MTCWKSAAVIGMFLAALGWSAAVQAEILGDYLGYTACEPCHPDLVAGWKTTGHARAFESLKTQGEEKQENPGCVKCHVVAYEKDGGYIDMELTPELKDVQCESCHGPGKKHTETFSADDLVGKTGEDVCRQCHTEGQDKDFDYEKKSKLVHGE
jgi:predicted CXXCH cytochrome family protein